ncbi:MFS transporter [Cohnella sp. GCM10027633]|uniref:MFS transporter n=1 Tax=unclassified Cohnella TaxID=2636738 RepID=UPI0036289919
MNQRETTGDVAKSGRFDRQTRLLLVVNGLFITANALSGTFLGVYIWKASHDFMPLGWFTLLSHIVMAATFWVAGNWVKEGNKMACLRLGIAASAAFYGTVLLLGKSAFSYIWLLGLVNGISIGLFWLAYNVVYFEATDAATRDRFNGLAGVMGSLVGIAVPWCSGYLLSHMKGDAGYRTIFMISLGIFVAGVLFSFLLRHRKTDGVYEWTMPLRVLKRSGTPWRPVFGALAAQGLRESVFGIMIGLLVFIHTGSELKLGNFVLLTSAVAFVSFYATGKWLKPRWRKQGMLIGTVAITAVVVAFFFGVNYVTLLVFGIVVGLFFPLYMIPMTSAVFDLIGQDDDSVSRRVEYVVMRELGLNAGRIAGMIVFMLTISISEAPLVINCLLLAVGSSPILSWVLMKNRLSLRHAG